MQDWRLASGYVILKIKQLTRMPEEPKPAGPPTQMACSIWEAELPGQLRRAFEPKSIEAFTYVGQNFFVVAPDTAAPVIEHLKLHADFDYLVDLTAIDYPKKPERFELVYVVYSYSRNERVRVKTCFAQGYEPATVTAIHRGANWLEREVYDMFGIRFAGHPNMTRILLPEEWTGFPLLKEYGITQMDNRWVKDNLGIESGQ